MNIKLSNTPSFFVVISILAVLCPILQAGFLYVPEEYTSIQSAIDVAGDGDTVVVRQGTYTGDGAQSVIDFKGKSITVTSSDPENSDIVASTVIANSQIGGRGVLFDNFETRQSVLTGFTLTGNTSSHGAAVFCGDGCSPTISNCVIIDNHAQNNSVNETWAGGIYCYRFSNPKIINCRIENNSADNGGGLGIHYSCAPEIDNCVISSNTAKNGGGIHCNWLYCSPVIKNCDISDNNAVNGGGLFCLTDSTPILTNCNITGNRAEQLGGGVYSYDKAKPVILDSNLTGNSAGHYGGALFCYYSATVANCEISDNYAGYGGGGMRIYRSEVLVTNCLFTGNQALFEGGAIFNNIGGIITNCTFDGNSAAKGGAVSNVKYCRLTNCIIFGSTSGGAFASATTRGIQSSYNNVYGNIPDNFNAMTPAGEGDLSENPEFFAAGYYYNNLTPNYAEDDYWIDGDYNLLPGSPCIDAADGEAAPTTDFNYNQRHDDLGISNVGISDVDYVDIGAYEFQGNSPTQTGELLIDTSPVKGQVFVDGQSWGTAPRFGSVTAGEHIISFGEVADYVTPIDQIVNVVPNEPNQVIGTYMVTLTLNIIGNGTAPLTSGAYLPGETVELAVTPNQDYQVKAWSGTDDDSSKANTNTVTIASNTVVTVEFEKLSSQLNVTNCIIKAGPYRYAYRDSFTLTGANLDISADEIFANNTIFVTAANRYNEIIFEDEINYDQNKFNRGRLFCNSRVSGVKQIIFDLNKKTFKISASNINLTGLTSPALFTVTLGNYSGQAVAAENNDDFLAMGIEQPYAADVVNGSRPAPLQLLNGYANALTLNRYRQTSNAAGETLTLTGNIAVADRTADLANYQIDLTWGDYTASIPAGSLRQIGAGKIFRYQRSRNTVNDVAVATFNLQNSTFNITIRNADIGYQSYPVNFSLSFINFQESLQITEHNCNLLAFSYYLIFLG